MEEDLFSELFGWPMGLITWPLMIVIFGVTVSIVANISDSLFLNDDKKEIEEENE